jgi:hypothetical protein
MLMVVEKIPSIRILQEVAKNVFLDKVLMWCHTLLLPAHISTMDHHLTITTKFAANFYRLGAS